MLAFLAALILTITTPATATVPAQRGPVRPVPPTERPAPADLAAIDTWAQGCTYTRHADTVLTARHCLPWNATALGWNVSGDRAWHGPEPAWGNPAAGATVYGVGYPHAGCVIGVDNICAENTPLPRTMFALTVLHATVVPVAGRQVPVLMTVGEGAACSSGASGLVGWWTDEHGTARPVGTLAVYSVDPAVTGLPAGQFVCGFAL